MEDHSDMGPIDAALCRFLNGLPLLLEIDEACTILGLTEFEFRLLASVEGLDTDEDCVMRDDLKKLLMTKAGE